MTRKDKIKNTAAVYPYDLLKGLSDGGVYRTDIVPSMEMKGKLEQFVGLNALSAFLKGHGSIGLRDIITDSDREVFSRKLMILMLHFLEERGLVEGAAITKADGSRAIDFVITPEGLKAFFMLEKASWNTRKELTLALIERQCIDNGYVTLVENDGKTTMAPTDKLKEFARKNGIEELIR